MDKYTFTNGLIEIEILEASSVFISCNRSVFIKRKVCDELFLIKNTKKGNSQLMLGAGEYEITVPNGCAKTCFVCVEPKAPEKVIAISATQVCVKLIKDDMDIHNVINAWACTTCSGDQLSINLFDINSGLPLEDQYDYEIL